MCNQQFLHGVQPRCQIKPTQIRITVQMSGNYLKAMQNPVRGEEKRGLISNSGDVDD